jgi:hypothetical protein
MVVFAAGRAIWPIDASTGRVCTIATTPATPVGVSMEMDRVVWTERLGESRYVRACWL